MQNLLGEWKAIRYESFFCKGKNLGRKDGRDEFVVTITDTREEIEAAVEADRAERAQRAQRRTWIPIGPRY